MVVVVVIVVVAFVKKIRSKKILIKNNSCPKNFRSKSVNPKKNLGEKKLGPIKFWSKI